MKPFNWRDITEIVGFISIVGGLIFVGLQLRQSQEIAIASQYQERASTAVDYYSSQMQNDRALVSKAEEIMAAIRSGTASPALQTLVENRSPESIGMWFYQHRVFFVMLDNFHYQYRSGFMAEADNFALSSLTQQPRLIIATTEPILENLSRNYVSKCSRKLNRNNCQALE